MNGHHVPKVAGIQIPGLRSQHEVKHRFKKKDVPAQLKIQLLHNDRPRAGIEFSLAVDGATPIIGKTDGHGMIKVDIHPHAQEAEIRLREGGIEDIHHLKLGELDPIDCETGVVQRLLNLGFPAKRDLKESVRAFQQACGLNQTGAMDDQTKSKLKEKYGL